MRQRGNLNEIMVSPGRQLDGKYTFMVEHVCPVGALHHDGPTSASRRASGSSSSAKTVCQGCATGCNAHLDYDPRFNKAYRYRPRDNEQVNKFWMCDEGMLTYRRAHDGRITEPSLQGPARWPRPARSRRRRSSSRRRPRPSLAVVFSAQHSLEDNWALRELAALRGGHALLLVGARAQGTPDDILIDEDKNPNTVGVQKLKGDAQPFAKLAADVATGAADDPRHRARLPCTPGDLDFGHLRRAPAR